MRRHAFVVGLLHRAPKTLANLQHCFTPTRLNNIFGRPVMLPVLLVLLLAFALTAATQPAPRMARVGMLCSVSCTGDAYGALSDELRKLGWIEGTTIVIERKEAGRRFDRLPELAADLVRSKPDLIVAVSPQPARC